MSLALSTLGLILPSIHNRKTMNHFSVSSNTNFSVCNAWESKRVAPAAKKKDHAKNTRILSLQHDYGTQTLKQVATKYSKLSSEEKEYMRTKCLEVYSMLKSEILDDPAFEWTPESRLWVQQMLDYNVPKGELGGVISVMKSYMLLKEGEELRIDELFDASIVGWCFEWLKGGISVLDDFMDNSHTRNGEACWFRVPKVGKIAINDAVLLMAHVPKILKKHFREKSYYMDLLDLFNEVVFLTTSGQMLDVITPGVEMDLSNYTLYNYRRIAKYKAGSGCYLPVACALVISGENLEKHVNMKEVLFEMGIYVQEVDDYLDCFGDPEQNGTDIEDFKCSWLIVKALELANEEQKKTLQEHYGKANPSDVAKVKGVYNDINLQCVFAVYEKERYDKLTTWVEAHPNKTLQGIWEVFATYRQLLKIHDL